jgi:uncharacterized protein (DUF1778 family)
VPKKAERVTAAVTPAERERMRVAALVDGATVSELLRRAGLREVERVLERRVSAPDETAANREERA